MSLTSKNTITLIFAVAVIVGAIFYLDSKKAHSESAVETTNLAINDKSIASTTPDTSPTKVDISMILKEKAQKYPSAVEIVNPSGFINTPDGKPITIQQYIGKSVILIDFMTYSCINCQRTFPYLNAWYTKYKDQGLIIIGIHTPEFDFEKNYDNVKREMARYGIKFPVVLDNGYGTWTAYKNQYWPRKYLIDIDGYIVEDHIGEGGYDETEMKIKELLKERADRLGTNVSIDSSVVNPSDAVTSVQTQSPETYFGSNRNEFLGNGNAGSAGVQTFTLPQTFSDNKLYLSGTWNMVGEYAQSQSSSASFVYKYDAMNLYFVASADTSVVALVTLDGKPVPANMRGSDVYESGGNTYVKINDSRLYNIVTGSKMETHTLQITAQSSGLKAFTLTFG